MLQRFRIAGLLAATFLVAACGPTPQEQADYAAVQNSGASPAIYDKMLHNDALSLSDIISLSHARVNDGIIVRYIRSRGTVYALGPQDIDYLHNNGVSPSVIDYMVQTSGGPYGPYGPGPYGPGGPVILAPPIGIGIGIGGGGGHWR